MDFFTLLFIPLVSFINGAKGNNAMLPIAFLINGYASGIENTFKCEKDEMFYMCKRAPRLCSNREMEDVGECEQGCDCRNNFYRLAEGSPCVHVSNCPKPECKEHEEYRECGPVSEYCNVVPSAIIHCPFRCFCKKGFVRSENKTCIRPSECPSTTLGEHECGLNSHEYFGKSGPSFEYCSVEQGETIDQEKCYCLPNHKRNKYGICINSKLCEKDLCDVSETFYECIPSCNKTCANFDDKSCVESEECYSGCFCKEGYLMHNNGMCVKPEKCNSDVDPQMMLLMKLIEDTMLATRGANDSKFTKESEEDDELRKGAEDEDWQEEDSKTDPENVGDSEENPHKRLDIFGQFLQEGWKPKDSFEIIVENSEEDNAEPEMQMVSYSNGEVEVMTSENEDREEVERMENGKNEDDNERKTEDEEGEKKNEDTVLIMDEDDDEMGFYKVLELPSNDNDEIEKSENPKSDAEKMFEMEDKFFNEEFTEKTSPTVSENTPESSASNITMSTPEPTASDATMSTPESTAGDTTMSTQKSTVSDTIMSNPKSTAGDAILSTHATSTKMADENEQYHSTDSALSTTVTVSQDEATTSSSSKEQLWITATTESLLKEQTTTADTEVKSHPTSQSEIGSTSESYAATTTETYSQATGMNEYSDTVTHALAGLESSTSSVEPMQDTKSKPTSLVNDETTKEWKTTTITSITDTPSSSFTSTTSDKEDDGPISDSA